VRVTAPVTTRLIGCTLRVCAKSFVSQLLRAGVEMMACGGCISNSGDEGGMTWVYYDIIPFGHFPVIIIKILIVIVYVNDLHKIATNPNIQSDSPSMLTLIFSFNN